MLSTAKKLGTITEALKQGTAEDQLSTVQKWFMPYKKTIKDFQDVYMVIFMPIGVGNDPNFVLTPNPSRNSLKDSIALKQNLGLHENHDGQITKSKAGGFVQQEPRTWVREGH